MFPCRAEGHFACFIISLEISTVRTRFLVGLAALVNVLLAAVAQCADPPSPTADSVLWKFDNIERVGGHRLTVLGRPRVLEVGNERAVEFDGKGDALLFDVHPLAGLKQFTAEIIFRPDADGPTEQRFFHMQEKGSEDRILFETRVRDGQWFLDTYVLSGEGSYTQFAENFKHPADQWYHAALVIDGDEMRHYVNGKLELSTKVTFQPAKLGQTSAGVRLNRVFWFKGAIRAARFTPRPLDPEHFLEP